MPNYNYIEFKKACGEGLRSVMVFGKAERDAKEHFNLFPKARLLRFINNNGLDDLTFLIQKNGKIIPIKVILSKSMHTNLGLWGN